MKINGACHCGAITFEAEVDPTSVTLCHCADCQRLSGSPYRVSVAAAAKDFTLLRGEPKIYVKLAESGARRRQGFCGDCGAPIYATGDERQDVYNLRIGAIAQRADLAPKRQIWCGAALPWTDALSGLPGHEKQ